MTDKLTLTGVNARIVKDLVDRNGHLCNLGYMVRDGDGFKIIGYDTKGLCNFTSDAHEALHIYSENEDGSFSGVCTLSKASSSKEKQEPKPKAKPPKKKPFRKVEIEQTQKEKELEEEGVLGKLLGWMVK